MATQVLINWSYGLSDQTGFLLQRSEDSASTWITNYPTHGDQYDYTDDDIVIGGTYWYHVAATNSFGTGSYSNTGSVFISGSGPVTLSLSVVAASDTKLFDGTMSSSAVPIITPDISIYGDINNYTQSFDHKFVGDRLLFVTDGGIINMSGNNYDISIDFNTGSITGPPTGSLIDGYIGIPADTDIPFDDGFFVDVPDVTSGSNGFLTFNYFPIENWTVTLTSSNGINWVAISTASFNSRCELFGAGIYVGFNEPGNPSSVQYSTDGGITWNITSIPTSHIMYDALYNGAKFVACGNFGTVLTSSNGIDWASISIGNTDYLNRIIYNSGRYVAVGPTLRSGDPLSSTGTIYTSTDLVTWQAVSSSISTTAGYYDVVYSPSLGIYIAVGEIGLMAKSTDGVNWIDESQLPPIYNSNLTSITWNPIGAYFAVSDHDGYIYNSNDGTNWTLNTINPHLIYSGNYYTYVLRMKYYSSINKFLVFGTPPPS